MESFVVTRQTFAVGKKDAFHIQLEYVYETRKVIITSSIPDWVLDEIPFPELTLNEKPPYFDMNGVNEKLTEYAQTLKKDQVARQFFYSSLVLNKKGKLNHDKSLFYRRAVSNFLCNKIPYTSVLTKPFTSLYLSECFKNAVCKENPHLKIRRINRRTFEMNLQDEIHKEEYTELYFRIKKFVDVEVINLRANMPSFTAGLTEKGEVLIAFVQHSLQLQHE